MEYDVLVAKGASLWELGEYTAPEMMKLFRRLRHAIDTLYELQVLDPIYAVMPRRNFSTHLLECAPGRLAVMELRDVLWSDWGHLRRITQMLKKVEGARLLPRRVCRRFKQVDNVLWIDN